MGTTCLVHTWGLNEDCDAVDWWTTKPFACNMDNNVAFEEIITTGEYLHQSLILLEIFWFWQAGCCQMIFQKRGPFQTQPFVCTYWPGRISGHNLGHLKSNQTSLFYHYFNLRLHWIESEYTEKYSIARNGILAMDRVLWWLFVFKQSETAVLHCPATFQTAHKQKLL